MTTIELAAPESADLAERFDFAAGDAVAEDLLVTAQWTGPGIGWAAAIPDRFPLDRAMRQQRLIDEATTGEQLQEMRRLRDAAIGMSLAPDLAVDDQLRIEALLGDIVERAASMRPGCPIAPLVGVAASALDALPARHPNSTDLPRAFETAAGLETPLPVRAPVVAAVLS